MEKIKEIKEMIMKEKNWKYILIFVIMNILFSIGYALIASVFLLQNHISGENVVIPFILVISVQVFSLIYSKKINKRYLGAEVLISTVITITISFFFDIVRKTVYYLKDLLVNYVAKKEQVDTLDIQKLISNDFFYYNGMDLFKLVTISTVIISLVIYSLFYLFEYYKKKKAIKILCGKWSVQNVEDKNNIIITKQKKFDLFNYFNKKLNETTILKIDSFLSNTTVVALVKDQNVEYTFIYLNEEKNKMRVEIKKKESYERIIMLELNKE